MKSIVVLLVVVVALSINAKVIRAPRDPKGLNNAIARTIAQALAVELRQKDTKAVLPEFPDPLEVENAELNFNELELDGLTGFVALRGGEVTGLSSVLDDLAISITIPARLTYTLNAGVLTAVGTYEVTDVVLDETAVFQGAGHLEASVTRPQLVAVVSVIVNLITNRFTVTNVSINTLVFDSVQGEAEGLTYNGEPVDWEAVNEDAKPAFDEFWLENRAAVEDVVQDLIADLLKDCKITDLLGGDYSCIALPETSRVSRARLAREALLYLL